MPYIIPKNRKALDASIDQLARNIVAESDGQDDGTAFAGMLNYACTRLALEVVKMKFGTIRYWIIAMISGVFKNIGDEFYRRLGIPYEEKKMEETGDVDLYEEFSEAIKRM